jgi:hypothetical protein
MALQKENRSEIVKSFFKEKKSIKQEHTPSSFKTGEEMPITLINGLYTVSGIDGLFTSRFYAEQAYKNLLRSKVVPALDKEIKNVKKRVRVGMEKESEIAKAEEKKKEWLETH